MRNKIIISAFSIMILLCGCGNTSGTEIFVKENTPIETTESLTTMSTDILRTEEVSDTEIQFESVAEQEAVSEKNLKVTVNGKTFSAEFCDNESAEAFAKMLPITIDMSDYSGFEKVGPLGQTLPSDDVQMTMQAGDIVLYTSNQIVAFYGSNSWSYTKPATITDLMGWEETLGNGDAKITFSIGE